MIGFEYIYKSPEEILETIILGSQYSVIEYSLSVVFVLLYIAALYYIVPYLNILKKYRKDEKEKKKKKSFIKQIILQKNIEAEIEEEMNI